ncbi:MAG: hypothetical protein QME64_08940 [bacterium]|nr:hypothetical protein [bacterium]
MHLVIASVSEAIPASAGMTSFPRRRELPRRSAPRNDKRIASYYEKQITPIQTF